MTVGQLRSFIENLPDQAQVKIFQGPEFNRLTLLEYDQADDLSLSIWVAAEPEAYRNGDPG